MIWFSGVFNTTVKYQLLYNAGNLLTRFLAISFSRWALIVLQGTIKNVVVTEDTPAFALTTCRGHTQVCWEISWSHFYT